MKLRDQQRQQRQQRQRPHHHTQRPRWGWAWLVAIFVWMGGGAGWQLSPAFAQADDPAPNPLVETIDFSRIEPFDGRFVGEVRYEAMRFNGEMEEIREIQGYANFIRGLDWLRRHILTRADTALRVSDVRDDALRLARTGLFDALDVAVQGGALRGQPITLIYRMRSKPVEEIAVVPPRLVTEGMASLKARLSVKEGEEYTEFKANEDVKNLTRRRDNLSHVSVRVILTQLPTGQYAKGLRVEYTLVENVYIAGVEFVGVDGGKGQDDLRKLLETARTGFLNPDLVQQDAQRIRDTYRDEGWYFCEVGWHTITRTDEKTGRIEQVLVFDVNEGPKVKVGELRFDGLELIVPAAGDKLFDMPNEWWDLWYSVALWLSDDQARQRPFRHILKGDEDFKPLEIKRDLLRMEELLRGNGWLDARVFLDDLTFSEDRTRVDLVFRFVPGPLYKVRSITIRGRFDALEEKDVYDLLSIREGMTYRRLQVEGQFGVQQEGDQRRVQRVFRDRGYYNAEVQLQTVVVPPDGVDLIYDISQGQRVRIGQIRIHGNDATRSSIILAYLGTQPGNWFSQTTLELDTLRLMRLNFFARPPKIGARLVPRAAAAPYDPEQFVDVDVYVEEGQTGTFNLGLGWSSERGIVGYLNVTKSNFDIADFPSFTGGGQEVSLNIAPGPLSQTYRINFFEPFFFGSRFSFGTSFAYASESFTSFDTLDWVVTGTFGYTLDIDLILRLGYTWNWAKAYNVEASASPAIQEAKESKVYSSFKLSLDFDRRDDIFFPSRGYNIQTAFEIGGQYIGGNVNWWHWSLRASYTIPIPLPLFGSGMANEPALSFRVAWDWMNPFGPTQSIPILKRLMLGGSATPTTPAMRGFALEGVGPRDDNGHSLRGTARLVGNVELRIPIRPGIVYGVVFFDIGQLQPEIGDLSSNRWNMAWGFGIRLRLPISPAPLALDFGFPISKFTGDVEQTVSFSLGFNF